MDKEDKSSTGYQFYKYLQREWLDSDSEPYDPDKEKEVEEYLTLTGKYNSFGDIDFSKEPKFVKWCEGYNWYGTLLYNGKVGLWSLGDRLWSFSYKIELTDGNKLRLVPLTIIHDSPLRE